MDDVLSLARDDSRIILHFDYDCFYASVFEVENPALKTQPLAVQQKQIIVTCNYEARRRGLYKLQRVAEARQLCPEAVIALGEDLTKFRNASKALFLFLSQNIWSNQAEKLGFDEVFLDCTDMIDYNLELLNLRDLANSFFCLDRDDPTRGFSFSATRVEGCTYPNDPKDDYFRHESLHRRLMLGSHLAQYLRKELEKQCGYIATVGISTNKLLSKLTGNIHKPNSQTTLLPPYDASSAEPSSIMQLLDGRDIGSIPGIGFKLSQQLRAHILGRHPEFDDGLVYGATKENVTVGHVRACPGMGIDMLDKIFSGPGAVKGLSGKVWGLLHGIDEAQVSQARRFPSQISIEDSYIRLDTLDQVIEQMSMLARSLVKRMHVDLLDNGDSSLSDQFSTGTRWVAYPSVLRLSTRPRPPVNPDGSRPRSFNRISRSTVMPTFALSLTEPVSAIADRLVRDYLLPTFKKLHPERSGWNLSLMNVAATNMVQTGADSKQSSGRDISSMLRQQDHVMREWKVPDVNVPPDGGIDELHCLDCVVEASVSSASDQSSTWLSDEEPEQPLSACESCGGLIPAFAMTAHERFHDPPD